VTIGTSDLEWTLKEIANQRGLTERTITKYHETGNQASFDFTI
jgi:predicted transcriptional regulator